MRCWPSRAGSTERCDGRPVDVAGDPRQPPAHGLRPGRSPEPAGPVPRLRLRQPGPVGRAAAADDRAAAGPVRPERAVRARAGRRRWRRGRKCAGDRSRRAVAALYRLRPAPRPGRRTRSQLGAASSSPRRRTRRSRRSAVGAVRPGAAADERVACSWIERIATMLPLTRREMLAPHRHRPRRARPGRPAGATPACSAAERRVNPLAPKAAALPGQGQARHPHLPQRRAVAGRHVRPQAAAGEVRRARRCRPAT